MGTGGRLGWRLLITVGLLAVVAGALPVVTQAGDDHDGVKAHDPGATASVDGGTTAAIDISIKNVSTSGNIKANGIRVFIPASMNVNDIISVAKTPSTAAGTITPYALPNGTLGKATPYIEILSANVARNTTYTITINVRIPCSANGVVYVWKTDVRQSNDFNGTGNIIPAIKKDPTPAKTTVASGCSLAFTTQPKNAIPGGTITSVAYNQSAPGFTVVVQSGGASPATVTWFSGSISIVSSPATAVSGTTSKAAVAGEATFGDVSISAADTYRFVASSTGLTSATSDPFTVEFGVTTTCDIDNAVCTTGTFPGPSDGTTGNVTVDDNDSLKATLTARFVTNDIDCQGYTEFGDRLFFDVQLLQGSLAGLTKTVIVTKPIPAGMPSGAGEEWRYQVCFQSRDQFAAITYSSDAQTNFDALLKALSGGSVTSPAEVVPVGARVIGDLSQDEYRGLLPQCSLVNDVAPCLVGLPTFADGKVTFVGKVPAADPVWK